VGSGLLGIVFATATEIIGHTLRDWVLRDDASLEMYIVVVSPQKGSMGPVNIREEHGLQIFVYNNLRVVAAAAKARHDLDAPEVVDDAPDLPQSLLLLVFELTAMEAGGLHAAMNVSTCKRPRLLGCVSVC
jgi:hypothetical protein